MTEEMLAKPRYARGEQISYRDRNGRIQTGKVRSVEAHWPGWAEAGDPPHLLYCVYHPTYRGNKAYINAEKIQS